MSIYLYHELLYAKASHLRLIKLVNRNVNINVSTSALSRAEHAQINELLVVSEFDPKKSGSHTNQSIVLRYFVVGEW